MLVTVHLHFYSEMEGVILEVLCILKEVIVQLRVVGYINSPAAPYSVIVFLGKRHCATKVVFIFYLIQQCDDDCAMDGPMEL